jgi:hypothetical protein
VYLAAAAIALDAVLAHYRALILQLEEEAERNTSGLSLARVQHCILPEADLFSSLVVVTDALAQVRFRRPSRGVAGRLRVLLLRVPRMLLPWFQTPDARVLDQLQNADAHGSTALATCMHR